MYQDAESVDSQKASPRKSKPMYIRLPANNVIGGSQSSERSEKKPRTNPPQNELPGLARTRKLLFPFIGSVLLQRLNLDNEERWSYMGEKGSRTYCTSLTGNGANAPLYGCMGQKGTENRICWRHPHISWRPRRPELYIF